VQVATSSTNSGERAMSEDKLLYSILIYLHKTRLASVLNLPLRRCLHNSIVVPTASKRHKILANGKYPWKNLPSALLAKIRPPPNYRAPKPIIKKV
jgi:hypothetical protein